MKVCGSCGAWIPDDATACPNCSRAVGGVVPPPPAAPGPVVPETDPDGFYRRRAEGRLRTLGTLYMVAGFLTLGYVALSFFEHASGAVLRTIEDLEKNPGPWPPDSLRRAKDLALVPWWLALSHAVPFLFGALWIGAGSSLRALRGRTSSLIGAALLLLPFPCSPCCCLLMPLGIYALIVLTRADSESILASGD